MFLVDDMDVEVVVVVAAAADDVVFSLDGPFDVVVTAEAAESINSSLTAVALDMLLFLSLFLYSSVVGGFACVSNHHGSEPRFSLCVVVIYTLVSILCSLLSYR